MKGMVKGADYKTNHIFLITFSKHLDEPEANFLIGAKEQGAWPACA